MASVRGSSNAAPASRRADGASLLVITYCRSMLDPLRFTARVVSELGRLGWARMPRDRGGLPSSIDGVDAAWVEGALAARFPDARVARIEVIGGSSGTTERRRLAVHYAEGARPEGAPASLFAKVPPPGVVERLFGNLFALGSTEVGFYRDVRSGLPVRAPECFAARSDAAGEFALLLGDLHAEGAAFPTLIDPVTVEEAKAVATTLATLHATYWGPEVAERLRWLRTPARASNEAVERFVCASAHRPTMKRFPELLPESVRRGAKRVHAERRALERYWASGPLTLIHGDPHVGNIYFTDGVPGLLDWQVAQHHQGIRDLAYFMILSLDTELRREHEGAVFRIYLERLHECGVRPTEAAPERLWELYRSFSLYAYMGTSVTATMSGLQSAAIATTGLRRAAAAVDDLDSLTLLDRLS